MCDPVSMVMAASTTVSVLGQVQAGRAAHQQADMQADQIAYQGRVTRDDALAQAQMIRKQQRFAIGSADTAAAASGIKVGEGSAGEVDRSIYNDSEHDAYMAILNGDRRARGLDTEAALTRQAGANASRQAGMGALGTVLSSGYQSMIGSGWRTAGPGWSGTQRPAPVENRDIPRG